MLSFFLFMAAAQAAPAAPADPLAPARAGKLQCYNPNVAAKSCMSLAGYSFAPDGSISNRAETLIAPQPALTMITVAPVKVKGGAVCGQLEGLDQATFTMNGQPADAQTADTLRSQIKAATASMAGKELCTSFKAEGDLLSTESTIDGQPAPAAMAMKVLWVAPADGYVVKP